MFLCGRNDKDLIKYDPKICSFHTCAFGARRVCTSDLYEPFIYMRANSRAKPGENFSLYEGGQGRGFDFLCVVGLLKSQGEALMDDVKGMKIRVII